MGSSSTFQPLAWWNGRLIQAIAPADDGGSVGGG
jgi:hypothetical protein